MKQYLKVKIKSLAAEAKIIRQDEKKAAKWARKARDARAKERAALAREGLHNHRAYEVRHEARAAHLAMGYLRGWQYRDLENTTYSMPNFDRVERLIIKYGAVDPRVAAQDIAQWKDEAYTVVQEAIERGRLRNIAIRDDAQNRLDRHADRKSEWQMIHEMINVDIESDAFPVGL